MKYERLKQSLIKRVALICAIITVVGTIFVSLTIKKSSLEDELSKIKRNSMSIINEAASSDEKNELIIKSLSVYKEIPESKLANVELKNISHRIRTARTLKEDLGQRYRLDLSNIEFSKIEDISSLLKTKYVSVHSNEIVMEFGALTDEIVMSFCHSMIEEAPGYISIESISINKTNSLTNKIVDQIKNEEAELPTLVKAKIVFNWRTLGDTASNQGEMVQIVR